MVSGIGPSGYLESFNITVVADRPGVGQNMWDTCNAGGVSYPVNQISPSTISDNTTILAQAAEEYLQNQTGPFTNSGGDYIGKFVYPPSPHNAD
jgi:choline dehydrogenase